MTFVNNVRIVNDLAERGISLVQDYVDKTVDEVADLTAGRRMAQGQFQKRKKVL